MGTVKTESDILKRVREHVQHGTYILREHAIERQEKRRVSLADVLRVLEYGRHEKEKDIFEVKINDGSMRSAAKQ